MKLKAILSTTILPIDGTYTIDTLNKDLALKILSENKQTNSYVGHPSTKEILEGLGIMYIGGLFNGLNVDEMAISVSIKQGLSTRKEVGYTINQEVTIDMLEFRLIHRIQ